MSTTSRKMAETQPADAPSVCAMFDRIAPTYDRLNRLLSLGTDQGWRRAAVAQLGDDIMGRPIVDLCAGTLDLTRLLEQAGARVVATDFAQNMLMLGRPKIGPATHLVRADAARLPLDDGSFAGALCGFGLRNLADPLAGLKEARRILSPGARLVVLDFFRPRRTLTRAVHELYNRRVLPLVGGWISGSAAAYRYLAESMERFLTREEAAAMALEAGFARAWGVI